MFNLCAGQACLSQNKTMTHTQNLCLLFCNNSHFHSNDWEELVKLFDKGKKPQDFLMLGVIPNLSKPRISTKKYTPEV